MATYISDLQTNNIQGGNQVIVRSLASKPVHTLIPAHTAYTPNNTPYIVTASDVGGGGDTGQVHLTHNAGGNQVIYQTEHDYMDFKDYNYSGTNTYFQQINSQHQSDGYVIHQGTALDVDNNSIPHTIRASPLSVQWLLDNYEVCEGVSLPRSTLYHHYLRHCAQNKVEPMNPASFGKLIRSVFVGLRTRRLGTRGNSQYHYYGIRIKSMSPLNQMTDAFTARQHGSLKMRGTDENSETSNGHSGSGPSGGSSLMLSQQHQQYLGDASQVMFDFGHIEISGDRLPKGLTIHDIRTFEMIYKDHCEAFLEIVINVQFALIETLWMSFWRNMPGEPENYDMEQRLSRDKLNLLCTLPEVHNYIINSDRDFYQSLVHVLIPDVLRLIPSSLTQGIRNFAKSLDGWLKSAMDGAPQQIINSKLSVVNTFAQILRRYTSLNHLAQAARAVLQNSTQINQMLSDINKVDFMNVQEQASWVCQCSDDEVMHLVDDFKKTLEMQTSLEDWAHWLERAVDNCLIKFMNLPGDQFTVAARQFLLKWSFYSSMVIRDLTLRSAASFGSFHLIRLLYDEYMFYLVERKVAETLGVTSIYVMGEMKIEQPAPSINGSTINPHSFSSTNLSNYPPIRLTVSTQNTTPRLVVIGQNPNIALQNSNQISQNATVKVSTSAVSGAAVGSSKTVVYLSNLNMESSEVVSDEPDNLCTQNNDATMDIVEHS